MFYTFKPFEASPVFKFIDPDTAYEFIAPNKQLLMKQIVSYREQNKLEAIESLSMVVDNYLCSLPENHGKCQKNTEVPRSSWMYIKGGIALLQNMMFPKFCSKDVADSRSRQCAECPHNVIPIQKTPFPGYFDAVAKAQAGDLKAEKYDELHNCEVCTCALKSKVWWGKRLQPFPEDQVEKLKKVKCWQLELSGQDK